MENRECDTLTLADACAASLQEGRACFDETVLPWKRMFLCVMASLETGVGQIVAYALLFLVTLLTIWVGVGLLSKVCPVCAR